MFVRKGWFIGIGIFFALHVVAQSGYDTTKPWTYWWWMGCAVNKTDIKQQLTHFSESGLGGVHIIPIYGVKGYEAEFIPFLSPRWMEMVEYTIEEASRLHLGVDITLGTGWPYGGKPITANAAAKKLTVLRYPVSANGLVSLATDTLCKNQQLIHLFGVYAINDRSERIDLSSQLASGQIKKQLTPGNWTLVCYGFSLTNQQVKRAAPGGEGLVMDYFSAEAVNSYLARFDSVFAMASPVFQPRAVYHDSYEVFGADWTTHFLIRFNQLRGYDLREQLPILPNNPTSRAVLCDVRETLSDLLLTDFADPWTEWSKKHQKLTRYQAHGSPGNILDLYALADIPETESFGCSSFAIPGLSCDKDYEEARFGRPSPLMMKFASSPAHLLQKPLVSSETGTWLANHFKVSLARIKPQVDELFISGINHVFYHGSTYSPAAEGFPGWLFYASTNFGVGAHFADELPMLNGYITRCQTLLQASQPDNQVLLYFPIHDLWTKHGDNFLLQLDVHKYTDWFSKTGFGLMAEELWNQGYAFDYLSDRQMKQLTLTPDKQLAINGHGAYKVLVVPPLDYISKSTLETLDSLAQKGACILFCEKWPKQLAGFMLRNDSQTIKKLTQHLQACSNVKLTNQLSVDLADCQIPQETLKMKGLDFIRKKYGNEYLYFITNLSDRFYEDSISLSVNATVFELFDPLTQTRGYISSETNGKTSSLYLQLPPGASCFLFSHSYKPALQPWQYVREHARVALGNPWQVSFVSGNIEKLQSVYQVDSLTSWTTWDDPNLRYVCGKARYKTTFSLSADEIAKNCYRLEFDGIHESAQICINGKPCGTIWCLPYQIDIPQEILQRENTLEVTVQNLSANRIIERDKMQPAWKKFYDINFVDIQYKPFDASNWELVPSGLTGRVWLVKTDAFTSLVQP